MLIERHQYFGQIERGYASVAFRLLSRVRSFDEECWVWTAGKTEGYGRLMAWGKLIHAHRLSYLIHKGSIPNGFHVMHTCDNRACINPAHLIAGTCQENLEDMRRKERHVRGEMFPQSKLTEQDARAILNMTGISQRKIAELYGVRQSLISKIRSRKLWKHVCG